MIIAGLVSSVRSGDHPAVWIEIHAAEQFRTPGASQDVTELVRRLIEGAKGQGISEKDMQDEVGDLTEYVRDEDDRTDRRK